MSYRAKWSLAVFLLLAGQAAGEEVVVHLEVSEVPEHAAWGEEGKQLMMEWYPRMDQRLASKDFVSTRELTLILKRSPKGVGATSGNKITVFSNWIESHPEDLGLLIHEMVHVIQKYPKIEPAWVTEGIADYLRWAVYEKKGQAWFPIPEGPKGYQKGYRATAGFFLWLESGGAPGIVKELNVAMREGAYDGLIFEKLSGGRSVDDLWRDYAAAHRK